MIAALLRELADAAGVVVVAGARVVVGMFAGSVTWTAINPVIPFDAQLNGSE